MSLGVIGFSHVQAIIYTTSDGKTRDKNAEIVKNELWKRGESQNFPEEYRENRRNRGAKERK